MTGDKGKNIAGKEDQQLIRQIRRAVLDFEEVVRFAGGITETFTNFLGLGNDNPGIRLVRQNDRLTVNLHVVVAYGVNIPQISYDIQNRVKDIIEHSTDCPIEAINVGIEGVEKK